VRALTLKVASLVASAGLVLGVAVAGAAPPAEASSTTSSVVPGQLDPATGQYYPIAPVSVLDTRSSSPLAAGASTSYSVLGQGGVPASGVTAVYLAVTAASPSASGCLVDYAGTASDPGICNTSFQSGINATTTDVVAVGTDGTVAVANQSSGTVNAVVRVLGYFGDGSAAAAGDTYVPVTEAVALDTRSGIGAPEAQVPAGGSVTIQLAGEDGIPADAAGVSLYVGAADAAQSGWVSVYPSDSSDDETSVLSYRATDVNRDLVFSQLGTAGAVTITNEGAGAADLIANVVGYFVSPTASEAGATFRPLSAQRLVDTRTTSPLAAGASLTFQATEVDGVPSTGVSEVAESVAALSPTASGYLTVYAAGGTDPNQPGVNFTGGDSQDNDLAAAVVSAVAPDGEETITNHSSGTVNVVVSTRGYFASATTPGQVTEVGSTYSDGLATVTWIPPTNDGGANVTGYTVTFGSGATEQVSADADSTTVPTTSSDTATVTATNAVGQGVASASVAVSTDSSPVCAASSGTAPTLTISDLAASGTNTDTPSISAVVQSSQDAEINGQIYLETASGTAIGGSPTSVGSVPSGERLTYSIPQGTLTVGASYQWYVVATAQTCPLTAAVQSTTQTFTTSAPTTTPASGPDSITISGSGLTTYSAATTGSVSDNPAALIVGQSASSQWTSAIVPTLTAIPAGSLINSATLNASSSASLADVSLSEATASPSSAGTGNDLAAIATAGTETDSVTNGSNSFDIMPFVQDWVDGDAPSDGLLLQASNSTAGASLTSSNLSLVVSYTPPTVSTAPTGLTVTPGDGSSVVGWATPADTGYVTSAATGITDYTVTATDPSGNVAATATTAGNMATLSGLTNGTSYTVSVSATNPVGTSAATTATATPTAASGGTSLYVTAVSQLMNDEDQLTEGTYSTAAQALATNSEAAEVSSWLNNEAASDTQIHTLQTQADEQDTNDSTSLSNVVVSTAANGDVTVYATATEQFTTVDTSGSSSESIPGSSVTDVAYTFSTSGSTPQIIGYADEDAVAQPASADSASTTYSSALDGSATSAEPLERTSSGLLVSSGLAPASTTGSLRQKMVAWELNSKNINSYNGFSDDCTDFISRSMNKGAGFPYIYKGNPTTNKHNLGYWYQTHGFWGTSTSASWANAQDLLYYENNHNATFLHAFDQVGIGDILFVDWKGTSAGANGGINHAALVSKTTTSNLYVTQHSPTQVNEPVYWEQGHSSWQGSDPYMTIWALVPVYVSHA
jgi:hypothetical protein